MYEIHARTSDCDPLKLSAKGCATLLNKGKQRDERGHHGIMDGAQINMYS